LLAQIRLVVDGENACPGSNMGLSAWQCRFGYLPERPAEASNHPDKELPSLLNARTANAFHYEVL
jgi:hypothetical protein